MDNNEFLKVVKESFETYLIKGTSRSTAKLKTLHGHIAEDLKKYFGNDFSIQSQGYGNDCEGVIDGRYYSKNVDITVNYKGKPVAGYAIKFVMRNYSQNSNNYFENMLGETANIRANAIPYFQVFIIFDKVPYYKQGGIFQKYDVVSSHNLSKYIALSKDDPNLYYHTPDKTLIVIAKLKEQSNNHRYVNADDYAEYYKRVIKDDDLMEYYNINKEAFDSSVIINDYEDFVERTYHIIMGKLKK